MSRTLPVADLAFIAVPPTIAVICHGESLRPRHVGDNLLPEGEKMKIKREPTRLEKRARKGHRGYPAATVAFYGPDASRASKVVVGIVSTEEDKPSELRKWTSDTEDLRRESAISSEILQFIKDHAVRTVMMSPGIIGCPHEEGIDYPEGEVCPSCPYWATRDRWTGEELPHQ